MAPRRCQYVEYDWFPNGRWLITSVWNHGLTLMDARVEIIGPNDPAIQAHVETVATAIDAMINAAAGFPSTRLKMGSATLDAVAKLDAAPDAAKSPD